MRRTAPNGVSAGARSAPGRGRGIWLGCPGGPAVPEPYVEFQGLTAAGRPRGIVCPGAVLNTPLEAVDGGAGDSHKRLEGVAN